MARGRQTITQRIALDGGAEIKKELESLGKVGEEAFKRLQKAAEDLKGPTPAFVQNLQRIQKEFEATGKKITDIGQKVRDVGRDMSLFLTAPITALGAGVIKVAADFESAMVSLQVATRATGDEFAALEKMAREIGKATSFGPNEAAQAMTELAKTGTSVEQILGGAADATVRLAEANDAQLAPAAKLVSDVLQQFGLKASQIGEIVSQVTGAVNESKLDFADFQQAIGQAGAVAGAFGVSFKDLSTALAATSSAFTSGSDAGTSFKTFLQRLSPTSREAAKLAEELGLKFFDAGGKMKPIAAIAQEIQDKFRHLTDEDRNRKMTEFFGTDAVRTAITLYKLGAAGIEEVAAAIAKTDAASIAEARMKGFNGQLKQLKGSLEDLAISIGKSGLLGFATDLVRTFADFIDRLNEASPATLRFATILLAVVAAIGPLVIGLGLFIKAVGIVTTTIGKSAGVFAVFLREGGKLAAFLGRFAIIPRLILGPWGLLATALITFWDDIIDAAKQFWEGLFGDPSKVSSQWVAAWSLAILKFTEAIKRLLQLDFSGAWDALKGAGLAAFDAIQIGATGSFGAILRDALLMFAAIRAAGLATALAVRTGFLTTLGATFASLGRQALALRLGPLAALLAWPNLFTLAIAGLVLFWPEIKTAAQNTYNGIAAGAADLKSSIEKALSGDWDGAWADLRASWAKTKKELTDDNFFGFVMTSLENMTEETKKELDAIVAAWNWTVDKLKGYWGDFTDFIASENRKALELMKSDLKTLEDAYKSTITWIKGQFSEIGQLADAVAKGDWATVKELLVKPFKDGRDAIKSELGNVTEDTKESASAIGKALANIGNKDAMALAFRGAGALIKNELLQVEQDTKDSVARQRTEILKYAASRPFNQLANDGVSEWARVTDAIIHGTKSAADKAKASLESVKKPAEDAAKAVVNVFRGGSSEAQKVTVAVERLAAAQKPLAEGAEGVVRVWKGGTAEIQKFATESENAGKKAGEAGKKAAKEVKDAWTEVKVKGEGAFGEIVPAAQKAADGVRMVWKDLGGGVSVLVPDENPFSKLADQAKEVGSKASASLKEALAGGLDGMGERAAVEAERMRSSLGSVADPLKQVPKEAEAAFREVKDDGTGAARDIVSAFDKVKGFDWAKLGADSKAAWREVSLGALVAVEAVNGAKAALDNLPLAAIKTAADETNGALNGLLPLIDELRTKIDTTLSLIEARVRAIREAAARAEATQSPVAPPAAGAGAAAGATGPFAQTESSATESFNRIRTAAQQLATDIATLLGGITVDWSTLGSGADQAFSDLRSKAESTAVEIQAALSNLDVDWTSLPNGLDQALDEIRNLLTQVADDIIAAMRRIPEAVASAMREAVSHVQSAVSQIVSALQQVEAQIRAVAAAAAAAASSGGGGGSNGDGFAGGGHIRGTGTSTSDSIPIWASDGEFMMNARAVRKYGLGLMHAINSLRFDPRKLKLPGFARGGSISMPSFKLGLPAFAGGGLIDDFISRLQMPLRPPSSLMRGAANVLTSVGAVKADMLRPLTLVMPGGQSFSGLMAPEEVADRLVRFAMGEQTRSAGRAPGWKR